MPPPPHVLPRSFASSSQGGAHSQGLCRSVLRLLFPGGATRGPPMSAETGLSADGLNSRFGGDRGCLPEAPPNTAVSGDSIQAPVPTYRLTCG